MLRQSKSHKPPFNVLFYQWKVEAGGNSFLREHLHPLYAPVPAPASPYQHFAVSVLSLGSVSSLPFLFSQI